MQAELESQWEAKCERLLNAAKEQHTRQYQEVCEQRDTQQQKVSQLEEKVRGLIFPLPWVFPEINFSDRLSLEGLQP